LVFLGVIANSPAGAQRETPLKLPMRLRLNLYAPFLGAGIRVKRLAPGWKEVDVEMKLRWWNANYVGTHYGGSLYSMTDPFLMVMLIENLGRDYIVWDKSATIRFTTCNCCQSFSPK